MNPSNRFSKPQSANGKQPPPPALKRTSYDDNQGTVRDSALYETFAELVEPVPDSAVKDAGSEERTTARNYQRSVARLTAQEQKIIAAVENRDEKKVTGGKTIVHTARPVVRPTRPGSAGVPIAVASASASARPASAARDQSPTMAIHVPRVFQKVIATTAGGRPLSATTAKTPSPPPQQRVGDNTAVQPSNTVVAPRPPTSVRPQTAATGASRDPMHAVKEIPTPSERIAHNELGPIIRTTYQNVKATPRIVRDTYRSGPMPIPAAAPLAHNEEKGEDVHLSHFLDANGYTATTESVIPDGAIIRAKYSIVKKDGTIEEAMRACKVISYNPDYATYLVEWIHNKVRKVVKPLAIMFPDESIEEYYHRVDVAEAKRDADEAMLRFEEYAKQRYSSEVVAFSNAQLSRVTALVASRYEEKFLPLINECIDDIEQLWNVSIRESIARYQLLSRSERQKVDELRLPHWRRPPPYEVLLRPATVSVTESPDGSDPGTYSRENFLANRSTLERELFVAYEPLYRTTYFGVNRWMAFERQLLVDTDVWKLNPPLEVSEFKKHQGNHNTVVVKALEKEWISSIVQCLQTELEGTFDFFLNNLQAFNTSRMSRYLRMINLHLAGQLQELIYASLESAKSFFKSLRVDAETLQAVRDEGIGGRTRKSSAFLRRVGCFATKQVVEPPFIKGASQGVPDEPYGLVFGESGSVGLVQGITPVLVCRFTIEQKFKKIICTPSLEETEDALREMFSIMLENTDSITGVGPQLFPMLNLRPNNLTEHARSVRRTDERVKSCEKELMDMLEENLGGPKALLNLYQPFNYLLQSSTEGFVTAFKQSGRRSAADFDAVCDRLTQHIDMIEQRSLNEVVFPLLKIDCHGIKGSLVTKAKEILHAILKDLIATTNGHIDDIDARYQVIFHRIQKEPVSPEELQELRAFVDAVPMRMAELQKDFDGITDEVQLLGKYGYMPDQEAFEKYWGSYSWPRKISIVMDDVPFQLQMFRAQFLALTHETTNKLQESIQDCARAVGLLSYEENEAMVDEVVRRVATIDETLEKLKVDTALANTHEQIFQQPVTKWTLLKDIEKQFLPLAALWRVTAESREVEKWAELNMERLDPSEITLLHSGWLKEINRLGKILLHEIPFTVVKYVKDKLEAFKTLLPVICALAKPSLLNRRRHVARIAEMINVNPKSFDLREKTPNELVRLGIVPHMINILEISDNADHEFKLETQLAAMREEWQKVNFSLQPYMDTFVLKDTDDIRNLADEHVVKTQTMLASPYASAILQELKPWEEKLSIISRTLDAWLQCQFGFRYLNPMFTQSEDIIVALPEEAKSFEVISTLWKNVVDSVGKVPSVVIRCSEIKLLEQFLDANTRLDKIMKELCRYLDQKREAFPRFYFLANEDLIEILSRSREPPRVQPYIQKCFEGIHRLTIEDTDDYEIVEMVSSEGECLGLFEPIFPQMFDMVVDKWLVKLEQIMCKTINTTMEKALQSTRSMSREEWIRVWPGQVCIGASQIMWTIDAEESIIKNTLPSFVRRVQNQVKELALMVRKKISFVEMCTLQALIVILVHAKDVAESLANGKVQSKDDFLWSSQLRYYWEAKHTVVRQTMASLPYGNEYLGNSSRLVITPLTDRCYRTLTAAYHLNYGGAPEGPAGTGKTETTKDLAKAIAKMCVVFNCSDQIKAFEMEKLLRGLAATGSWGCFDEFNRIEVQVLSVIAQQVLTIQLAVSQKRPQFLFEDRLCALKEGCSVFITMNPGYAGRTELPDNLKALFRPVAMMVPDYAFIAENSLYSCGFLEATVLAKKIVAAYKLSSEQLSSQSHYDFGMRAVKSVLSAAQNLRQLSPSDPEAHLVMRAILDVNKPKFLANDAILFDGIVSDLFGNPRLQMPNYAALDEGIRRAALEDNLEVVPFFSLKMKQIYEMVKVRHGVMVVGHSVSGKTAALKTLAAGLTWAYANKKTNEPCQIHTLNPKAITLAQLYGYNDVSGTEWYDGILSHVFRECASSTDKVQRNWIALDGPVDSIWIENMNTVLDDNKKLCLTNGDIIRMSNNMTMVFVVQDLVAASPATVSRCGMVYFEPQELGWKPLYQSWLRSITILELRDNEAFDKTTEAMIHGLLPAAVQFVVGQCVLSTPHTPQMIFLQFFKLLRIFITEMLKDEERISAAVEADMQMYIEGVVIMALTWGAGGLLSAQDKTRFDAWIKSHIDMDGRKQQSLYRITTPLPEGGTIFQYKFEIPKEYVGRPSWTEWLATVHESPIETMVEEPYQDIIVATSENASVSWVTKMLLSRREPVLYVGSTATGKTMLIKNILKAQNPSEVLSAHIQFSAQTTAKELQFQLERRLERRGQRKYGPPLGKSMIAFVDDLGMPEADQYGTQPPIELLRQFLMQDGFYCTTKNEFGFRHVQQVSLVGATQPAGMGRSMVTNRLLRHFISFFLPAATPETMKRIFGRLFEWIVLQPNVNPAFRSMRDSLVTLTVDTFTAVSEQLLPSPTKSHYLFNLRDLGSVWLGVSGMHPASTRDESALLTMVVHECMRVFSDRLVCQEDVDLFEKILDSNLNNVMKRSFKSIAKSSSIGQPLLFTNFINAHGAAAEDDRHYIRIPDVEGLALKVVNEHVEEMKKSSRAAGVDDIVVFDYFVTHVARIARIIQQPSGSVLLMGLGGTGRRSAAKMAAYICGFATKRIQTSSKYTKDQWTEDVIHSMRQSGERGESLLFLLTDTDIKDESFLEDVSSLLNTGDVPGLLSVEIQDAITHTLKNTAKELGKDFGREGCMELMISRVRANLHFALCFSPAGDAMRIRLRRFPSLINCTTMNWMPSWPPSALEMVAQSKLAALADVLTPEETQKACRMLLQCFTDTQAVNDAGREGQSLAISMYVTPTAFLELISMFGSLLRAKIAELKSLTKRYEDGLAVIASTELSVASMQRLLEVNRPKLIEKGQQVVKLIEEIDAAKAIAKEERDLVAVEEAQANRIAEDAKAVFDDCEANLAVALPAMKAATDAVSQIDKKQIVELRSLANPSDKIKKVIEAVCILLEVKPKEVRNPKTQKKELDYWTPTKTKVMSEVEVFRDMLINYDKDNMKPEIFEDKIQPFIKDKTFRPETVKDVSQALVGVTQWVIAMETYYRVRKVVRPKQLRLAEAEAELKQCQDLLNEKKKILAEIDARLAAMTKQLEESLEEKELLEKQQAETEVKLERAIRLNAGLADEKIRYGEQVVLLKKKATTIFADCLLSSSILGCLGPFPQEIRQQLRDKWLAFLKDKVQLQVGYGDRTFNEILSSPVEELKWKVQGLPLDQFSVDSAVISKCCRKFPLLVDPQGQAINWIRHAAASVTGQTPTVIILKHGDSDMHAKVVQAVQKGHSVLLEDCGEEVDPFLYPVLDQEVTYYNGAKVITLGGNSMPYNDNFHLTIATKSSRPSILPSTSARTTVIQFSITPSGLMEQLLQRVIAHEDRDQEEKRNRVVEQQASSQQQLIQLEDTILDMLSSGKDLLADDAMCEQLETSKKTSQSLMARLADAEAFQKSFDKIRSRYLTIAIKSSGLFFAVASLPNISNMYDYSLGWYTQLLLRALERPHEEGESRSERCDKVLMYFYQLLHLNVTKALFAKDKLAFTTLMYFKIAGVSDQEISLLVNGPMDIPLKKRHSERPSFLSEPVWHMICQSSEQSAVPLHYASTVISANDQDQFGRYCTEILRHDDAEHGKMFDHAFAAVFTPIQRLILVKLLAPRFLVDAVGQVISSVLGKEFMDPPSVDVDRTMKEQKDPTVPLIFVLAPGGDPLAAIRRFAELSLMSSNLDTLSLGSGMDVRAQHLIKKAYQTGRWVVLQNCHLYPDWLPELDATVEFLAQNRFSLNNTFRLILTTAPTTRFPQNLLQRSVKVVMEPPSGIRANLTKLLSTSPMTDLTFFDSSKNPSVFKRLCFSLCVFHSVVQERRSFGPIGWNIPYEFTDIDLRISLSMLQLFVDRAADALLREGISLTVAAPPPVPLAAAGNPALAKAVSMRSQSDEEITEGLSYDALQYLIGECNYGGRVTDIHDRRLLLDLLKEFVGPRVFDDGDPLLDIPTAGDIALYQQYAISRDEKISGPEMLGLDSNALISRDERQAQQLLQLVSSTMPKTLTSSSEGGDSADGGVGIEDSLSMSQQKSSSDSKLSPIETICAWMLGQLPPPFNIAKVEERYPPADYDNSLNSVLVQELQRFNRLTNKIRATLKELIRALRGEAVLTSELDQIATELLVSQTPRAWKALSYPCLKPSGSYIADLVKRLQFFQEWIDNGPQAVCWLGGLFFPQSFITGTLQNYCRRKRVTIDTLTWKVKVLAKKDRPVRAPAEGGCYLSGLFLEGCRWDDVAGTLATSVPKVLIDDIPTVHLFPVALAPIALAMQVSGTHVAPKLVVTKNEDDEWSDDDFGGAGGVGEEEEAGSGSLGTTLSSTVAEEHLYQCPVYRTQDRHGVLMTTGHSTNFLMHFFLPIPAYTTPSMWVKRGVALFTTTSL